MSTTTPYMGLTKPEEGDDTDVWGGEQNDSADLIDAHTHETGKGVPVPVAGLNIDDDLSFAGNVATDLGGATFAEESESPGLRAIWWNTSDDAFYLTNASGVDIQLTSGATLDFSGIGGIEGDYGSANASFFYDQATLTYWALQSAPTPNVWAAIGAGNVDLYEKASGITKRVRLTSPAALANSYVLEFPAALPGSTLLLQVSSAGAITASNTIINHLAMAANKNVTVSGTGEFKHGNRTMNILPVQGNYTNWQSNGAYMLSSGAGQFELHLPLHEGDRIQSVVIARYGNASASFTSSTGLKTAKADGTFAGVTGATGAIATPAAAWADTTFTPSSPAALVAGEAAILVFVADGANLRVGPCRVVYDRP